MSGRIRVLGAVVAVVVTMSGCAWVGRVGVSTAGEQPSGGLTGVTAGSDVSRDGRYVVFTSDAPNLVADDTNGTLDVFLRDNQTKTTERVSIADDESEATQGGFGGLVSVDARFVAFTSVAGDLVAGDTNIAPDVFLRDRQLGTTVRVSAPNSGQQSDGPSFLQSMTPNGQYIVFTSDAENLIGTSDTNLTTDVYLRNMDVVGSTRRISVGTANVEGDLESFGGSISDNGRYIVFLSNASTFDDSDSGAWTDVFLRDRSAQTTKRITSFSDGNEADENSASAFISGDGKVVTFDSGASNLVDPTDDNAVSDVYAKVLPSGAFERISVAVPGGETEDADGASVVSGISDDGRFVLFQSGAKNLLNSPLNGASNSFLRDRVRAATALAGTTNKMGEPSGPNPAIAGSSPTAISGDGRYVLFESAAADVLETDTNGAIDIYLQSNPVPFIFFASPATIARGTSGTISLHGSGLHAGALVLMGAGVTVTGSALVSENQLDVAVTVAPDAEVGPHTPFVIDAGTGAGGFTGGLTFLPGAFSVT